MIKEFWESITPQFKLVVLAPIALYLAYKLGLELWCIAYGIGMNLGLL